MAQNQVSNHSLTTLWRQAVTEFDENAKRGLSKLKIETSTPNDGKEYLTGEDWEQAFFEGAPDDWKRTFEGNRNPGGNVAQLRTATKDMLFAMQHFAEPFLLVIEGAANAFAPLAPAAILAKGLFWVMKSFSAVSMRLDNFVSFCEKIKETFENISVFKKNDLVNKLGPVVSRRILGLFKSVLKVYGLCIEEPKKRTKTWWHNIVKGDGEIQDAFSSVEKAKGSLNNALTMDMVATSRRIEGRVDEEAVERKKFHEMDSAIASQRHTEIISRIDRMESWHMQILPARKSKDPAARKDADIMWLREQLAKTDQSRFVQDLQSLLVEDASRWVLDTKEVNDWISSTGSRTLWISGAPGSGKTYLALSIIAKLRQKPTGNVAYFFFREDWKEFRDLGGAFSCMVVNRAEEDTEYRKLVVKRLKTMNQEAQKDLDSEDIWKEFFVHCQPQSDAEEKQQNDLFLVLDGIDEANKDVESKLLSLLPKVGPPIRLLITSRDSPKYNVRSLGVSVVDTSAISKDQALNGWRALCRSRVEVLPRLKRFRNQTKKHITKIVSKHADGVLYVETMLIRLEAIGLEQPVLRELQKEQPKNVDDLHDLILKDCYRDRDEDEKKMLKDLFAWLAFAKRDLSLREAEALVSILANGKKTLRIEREVMQRLSGILDIFGSFDKAEDNEDNLFGQDDYDSDSDDDSKLDHGSLPLRFSKRWLRDFFKKGADGNSDLKKTPYESHLVIFHMSADIICTEEVKPLTAYAAKYWVDHFLEVNEQSPKLEDISDDICSLVVNSLRKILDSEGNIAFKLEEYGKATYKRLKGLEGKHTWVKTVQRWAKRGASMSPGSNSEAAEWARGVLAKDEIREIMIPLAESHFKNIFDQTGSWWSNEVFRFACDALSLTSIASSEVKKPVQQMTAQDVRTIIRHYVDKFQLANDGGAVDRAIAFIQEDFGQEEALESFGCALNGDASTEDRTYCLVGLARIYDQRGDTRQASKKCEEALKTITEDATQDDSCDEKFRSLKREAYLMLAQYKVQDSLAEDDEEKARSLSSEVLQFLGQAQKAMPEEQLAAKDLDALTYHFARSHDAEKLMQVIKTWPQEAHRTWLTWVFHNENRASLNRFREAALVSKEEQMMLKWFTKITRSSFHTDHRFWALYELAWTYRYTLNQAGEAKRVLRQLLEGKNNPRARKWLYDARLDLADIIYSDFRGTVRRKQREALLEEMSDLPPLDNQDLANSLISVPLARMTRVAGEMKKFEEVLNGTFNVCIAALEDGEEKNDQDSFRLLAKLLSCLPGLEEQAKIAYSLQFSVLAPGTGCRPDASLYRSYTSAESRDEPGTPEQDHGNIEVVARTHQESISEHMTATDRKRMKDWRLPPCPWSQLCCLQLCFGGSEREPDDAEDQGSVPEIDSNENEEKPESQTSDAMNSEEDGENAGAKEGLMDNDKSFEPNYGPEDLVTGDEQSVRCNGCNDCNVSLRWWKEPLYLCTTCCTNIDLCSRCLKKLKASTDGKVEGNFSYYCGKDHRYIRGPITGWLGVRDRYICIASQEPVYFDDWLRKLKNEDWRNAWKKLWETEVYGKDIF